MEAAIAAAIRAVGNLWQTGDPSDTSGYGAVLPGPVYNFPELEPLAEAAIRDLEAAISEAVALRESDLVRHLRRLLFALVALLEQAQPVPDGAVEPPRPPGREIVAFPLVPTGPPLPPVAAPMRGEEVAA